MNLAVVLIPAEEGDYTAFVEEIPGAITQVETMEEARENLRDALRLVLECNRQLARETESANLSWTARQNDLPVVAGGGYDSAMQRTVHKARGFQEAAEWDIEQQRRITPEERRAVALQLRRRVYGPHPKDVRACHQSE